MIKVYKYTIICISFIMFFSLLLYSAYKNDLNPIYETPKIELIEIQ